jgi:hypothetical protein
LLGRCAPVPAHETATMVIDGLGAMQTWSSAIPPTRTDIGP